MKRALGAATVLLVLVAIGACGGDTPCSPDMQICRPGGVDCVCSQPCTSQADCQSVSASGDAGSTPFACDEVHDVCVPADWLCKSGCPCQLTTGEIVC